MCDPLLHCCQLTCLEMHRPILSLEHDHNAEWTVQDVSLIQRNICVCQLSLLLLENILEINLTPGMFCVLSLTFLSSPSGHLPICTRFLAHHHPIFVPTRRAFSNRQKNRQIWNREKIQPTNSLFRRQASSGQEVLEEKTNGGNVSNGGGGGEGEKGDEKKRRGRRKVKRPLSEIIVHFLAFVISCCQKNTLSRK